MNIIKTFYCTLHLDLFIIARNTAVDMLRGTAQRKMRICCVNCAAAAADVTCSISAELPEFIDILHIRRFIHTTTLYTVVQSFS